MFFFLMFEFFIIIFFYEFIVSTDAASIVSEMFSHFSHDLVMAFMCSVDKLDIFDMTWMHN